MAMQFNLPPAGTTLNANTALENLRLGYMVDRFTGAAVDRDIGDQAAAVATVTGNGNEVHLNIGSVRNSIPAGSYHISDRIITMNTGALLALDDGVHISFYNCTFAITEFTTEPNVDFRMAFGITELATNGGTDNRAASARVDEGVGNTRSINFYGCTVTVASQGDRGRISCQFADSIGTDFRILGEGPSSGNIQLVPSPQRGGRWINTRIVAGQQRNGGAFVQTYGFPDVYESVELYGFGLDAGVEATSSGPRMLIEPNFSLLGQTNIFTTQGVRGDSAQSGRAGPEAQRFQSTGQILQNIGFFTPPNNANNDTNQVIGSRAQADAYINFQNGGGGCLNYAAYQPTYRDAITGAGLQNVKVRVNTSASYDSSVTTTAANFDSQFVTGDQDSTIGTSFFGNEYLTSTTGQLQSSQYTTDGWSTSTAGYFDPMEIALRTAVGSDQLAENTLTVVNLTPPANTALALIQDARGAVNGAGVLTANNFNRHEAQYQAFSWSHDILQELTEDSTTLIDGTTRATSTLYGINRDISVTAPSVIDTLVKRSVTASDNTPILSDLQNLFAQDATPSINDVRMAIRYARYQYTVLGNPQITRTNLTVDNTHGTQWTVTQVDDGYITTVRGAGLAADTATDLYTGDPFLGTVNMNGNPITGLSLGDSSTTWNGFRTGDAQPSYATQGGAISGTYTSTGGSIYFDGTDVSGLNIIVSSGTLSIYGTAPDGTRLEASDFGSITGTANFPAPVVTLTVNTPDEPGYFGVRNVTQNSVVKLDGTPVGENAITTGNGNPGSFEIPSGSTDTYRFYWKRANDSTAGYSTTIIDRSNSGLTMSMAETMSATPLIATLYSGDARLGKANVADPSASSRAASNNGLQILVNNNVLTNGAESQYHILSAMDWVDYIDVLTENNLTSDLINPDTVSSTVSDAAYIQFNTATDGEQQQLVGAQFTNVNGIDNMLYERESFANTEFAFVTSTTQRTGEDRFFIRDRENGNILPATGNTARWPGITGSAIQITDADLVAVDVDDDSALATFLQALETRGFELADVRGQIQPRNSAGIQRADFNFLGITRTRTDTGTEYTFTLTAVNRPNTSIDILSDQGFASGTTGTMLGGNTLTGAQSDQVVQISGTGFSFPSVTLFPNPAGATPAQIQQAAETAINSSTSIAQTRNGVGYLIGTGGDSRLVGIKPRATNYDSTQPYGDNL